MTDKEVMQMALDALEQYQVKRQDFDRFAEEIEALRTALAQGEQEPFGYFKAEPFGWTDCAETDEGAIPLYERPVAPPQRPWQGLTEQDTLQIRAEWEVRDYRLSELCRAIEAKLKEKNK